VFEYVNICVSTAFIRYSFACLLNLYLSQPIVRTHMLTENSKRRDVVCVRRLTDHIMYLD